MLSILVDGADLSELPGSQPGFGGFGADEMLGTPIPAPIESGEWRDPASALSSPLLQDARRVALYKCSCGEPGCGVIAPILATDGEVVTWSDFRDYTGVFSRPDDPADDAEGRPLPIPQVRFDARQYEAEVERAIADRSWESPSRITARVLRAMLAQHEELLRASDRRLGWVSFAWWAEGAGLFAIELRRAQPASRRPEQQFVLAITAKYGTPTSRARSIVDRLLAIPVEEWHTRFRYDRT